MSKIHDELVEAYLEYFKINEQFEARNSVRTHVDVRRELRRIRTLAKQRMDEIHEHHINNRKTRKGKKDN
jgi:hypothetical protein